MEIFFILTMFFVGTVFGSFFTLAVYRIPLGKNITHERSFCPKCSHRLEFKDLIPVFSYIFLKGKCRYCGEKVRPRYLILEILSGIVFVLAYISVKINILGISYLYLGINYENTVEKLIYLLAFICFYITNAIIIGIDNENRQISKKVLMFGIITQAIYILYLYIVNGQNIYRYGIYLIMLIIVGVYNLCTHEKKYIFQILMYLLYIITFIGFENLIILIPALIVIIVGAGYLKPPVSGALTAPLNKGAKFYPIGFCVGIAAIIIALISNFINI